MIQMTLNLTQEEKKNRLKESKKRYEQKNREKRKEWNKKYYETHKDQSKTIVPANILPELIIVQEALIDDLLII